jgi:replicative DNA helicase
MPHGMSNEPKPIIDIIRKPRSSRATGMTYGLTNLDRVVPPAKPGNMIVVAGYAGIGKSWVALGIVRHWAYDAKYPVLFASLEMSEEEVGDRFLLYGDDIESDPHFANLYVEADVRLTTAVLRSKAAALKMKTGGITAICVDYLQLLTDRPDMTETHERVMSISRELKSIAMEFNCPVLALSQFNREGERAGRKPRLSDLAQSGAIERDADAVFGLWKEKRTDDWVEILVLKHRHGQTGATIKEDFALARNALPAHG